MPDKPRTRLLDRLRTRGEFAPAPNDGLIICRCEEITQGEIRRAIYDGMVTIAELRRFLRIGMGLCQGQTCGRLVKGILARELGVSPAGLESATSRSPMRPVEMRVLANDLGSQPGPRGEAFSHEDVQNG